MSQTTATVLNRQHDNGDFPAWATRSERSLGPVKAPPLQNLGEEIIGNRRRVAVMLISRPIAAALIFLLIISQGWWLGILPSVWFLYGSTISAVHQLIHSNMGLSTRSKNAWLSILGCLVVESGHALRATHLLHHRTDPSLPDPEGYVENVSWRQLPLAALSLRYRLAWWGMRYGPNPQLVRLELAVHSFAHIVSLILLPSHPLLWIYLTSIHLASFLFAITAGRGPQTNWGRPVASPFVLVRSRLARYFLFSHDLHLEHHIYPTVPIHRLRRLGQRWDPILTELELIDVKIVV